MSEGISFPAGPGGKVSTTVTGKNILASSVASCDPELARSVIDEKAWRDNYPKHCVNVLRNHCLSKQHALAGAYAGLQYAYEHFTYPVGGESVPLHQVGVAQAPLFATRHIGGRSKKKESGAVSIDVDGARLTGKKAVAAAANWHDAGLMEKSALENLRWVFDHEEVVLRGLEDTVFVVFGAGSALGPFSVSRA